MLDIGCGHDAHGTVNIDLKHLNPKPTNFIQADACHLPIRDDSVNEVVCRQVIEHLEAPVQMLREAKRVLHHGGSVTVSTPNPLHWRRLLRASRGKTVELGFHEHINCWTQHEIENLVQHADLALSKVWFETPQALLHAHKIDRYVGKLLPKALGQRHLMVKATNGF